MLELLERYDELHEQDDLHCNSVVHELLHEQVEYHEIHEILTLTHISNDRKSQTISHNTGGSRYSRRAILEKALYGVFRTSMNGVRNKIHCPCV